MKVAKYMASWIFLAFKNYQEFLAFKEVWSWQKNPVHFQCLFLSKTTIDNSTANFIFNTDWKTVAQELYEHPT